MSEGVRSHSKSCAGGEGFLRGAASSNLLHNKVLHARVVLVTMITDDVPYVPASERVQVEELDFGFYRVFVRYGFKDDPDIPAALALAEGQGLPFVLMESSFFLGRETLIPRAGSLLGRWREQIFILMFRNAHSAADFFCIPANRVVEFGTQIEL
jgi:KUP system potassium uptake protein